VNLNKLHYEEHGEVTQGSVSYKIVLLSVYILSIEVCEYLIVGF